MKAKLLLLLMGIANLIWAQQPYRNLVITEANTIANDYVDVHYELTNMGDSVIDLSEISFHIMDPQHPVLDVNAPWHYDVSTGFVLPSKVVKILQPGESYVLTVALDFGVNMFNARIPEYGNANRGKRHDIYDYADFLAHMSEKNPEEELLYPYIKDSVTLNDDSTNFNVGNIGFTHRRDRGFLIQHQYGNADSLVAPIDQVGATLDDGLGRTGNVPHDVAGVADGMARALVVRKYSIKQGNLDFNHGRGLNADESEWIAIPYPDGVDNWRDTWWTVQNHGPYVLDANTLKPKSTDVTVNFGAKTITVPWGTRRLDDVMRKMERTPGVAWVYHLNGVRQDSLLRSVQPGDSLTVYVCGEALTKATFSLIVNEPTNDRNIVIPIDHANPTSLAEGGPISNNVQHGELAWPRVTDNDDNTGLITGVGYGLPNELRIDSLIKYLEKPANASWELVLKDGDKRPNLRTGDKLLVTSQSGSVREYTIEVQGYTPSHNASLSSITWPDISLDPFTRIINGWVGDTIPNFAPGSKDYRVSLPFDVESIPALVAKTEQINANVKVKRATSFDAGVEERTISFTVTAEDDSVQNTYNVELSRDKRPEDVQPFIADPFVSEICYRNANFTTFLEICNPGTQDLDLSDYMIVGGAYANHVNAITAGGGADAWMNRYNKYIPGYKWVDSAAWRVTPATLTPDINVPNMLAPGDVFVLSTIDNDGHVTESGGYPADGVWPAFQNTDVLFTFDKQGTYGYYTNPWGEPAGTAPVPRSFNDNVFLLKILNDSVKMGTKPATDPADFKLIDALGMADNSRWNVAGKRNSANYRIQRKPDILRGNPVMGASFGPNKDTTEWIATNRVSLRDEEGINNYQMVLESDIGTHFFNPSTTHLSTVTAVIYNVSTGYSQNESIKGVLSGTTVADFIGNLYKADEGEILSVKSGADGSTLTMEAMLSANDVLEVMSADSVNITKYLLDISALGLSSDAVLTSTQYSVSVTQQPLDTVAGIGTLGGFDYGTTLATVLSNINVPAGAKLTVIDAKGGYVPLKNLKLNSEYGATEVNTGIYLSVVAENTVTEIIYQLQPNSTDDDAFVVSNVYGIDQNKILINYVPGNTSVDVLLGNLIPSSGATMKVTDKMRNERTKGTIAIDDKVVVTSKSGNKTTVYYISILPTELNPENLYFAYILSNDYSINQATYEISGVAGGNTVSQFLEKVVPSAGATVVVMDANGTVKNGELASSDIVKVTSANGFISVSYTFTTLLSANLTHFNQIELYPNPTNSRVTIKGLAAGSSIKIYNATGAVVRNMMSYSPEKEISLEGENAGLYLIVISNGNDVTGRYKVLKK